MSSGNFADRGWLRRLGEFIGIVPPEKTRLSDFTIILEMIRNVKCLDFFTFLNKWRIKYHFLRHLFHLASAKPKIIDYIII